MNWFRHMGISPVGVLRGVMVLMILCGLSACASRPADPVKAIAYDEANDPLEPFNRAMLDFNSAADKALLKPVAEVYDAVLPVPAKTAIRNALNNMGEPVTMVNDLLQGEFVRARESFTRFIFNSTFGLGGLVDFMGEVGMKGHDEDFGQTLAVWGVGDGPYLVLPLLGPSNLRDLTGTVVDAVADPVNRTFRGHQFKAGPYIRTGTEVVDGRSRLLGVIGELESSSVDYYTALRSAYRQRRQRSILNGNLPPLDDLYGDVLKDDGASITEDRGQSGSTKE